MAPLGFYPDTAYHCAGMEKDGRPSVRERDQVWVAPHPQWVLPVYPTKRPERTEPEDGISIWVVLGVVAILFFLFFGVFLFSIFLSSP